MWIFLSCHVSFWIIIYSFAKWLHCLSCCSLLPQVSEPLWDLSKMQVGSCHCSAWNLSAVLHLSRIKLKLLGKNHWLFIIKSLWSGSISPDITPATPKCPFVSDTQAALSHLQFPVVKLFFTLVCDCITLPAKPASPLHITPESDSLEGFS